MFNCWDTAGQEKYVEIMKWFLAILTFADLVVCVMAITLLEMLPSAFSM